MLIERKKHKFVRGACSESFQRLTQITGHARCWIGRAALRRSDLEWCELWRNARPHVNSRHLKAFRNLGAGWSVSTRENESAYSDRRLSAEDLSDWSRVDRSSAKHAAAVETTIAISECARGRRTHSATPPADDDEKHWKMTGFFFWYFVSSLVTSRTFWYEARKNNRAANTSAATT